MTLFVYHSKAHFVQADHRHIGPHRSFYFRPKPMLMPVMLLCQAAWLLWHLPRARCVYVWFADYHAFLPVLLGRLSKRRTVVALGGYDADCLPEVGYGVYVSRWRTPLARYVVRHCDHLVVLSERMIETLRKWVDFDTPYSVIYWDQDDEYWTPKGKKTELAMTVSASLDEKVLYRKGLAPYAPGIPIASGLTRDQLREWYRRHKVFVQISRVEGLPNALCEAMLCGCVPVVTDVAGMPEVVGDTGFLVDGGLHTTIRLAAGMNGDRARKRIQTLMKNQRGEKLRHTLRGEGEDGKG